MATVSDDALKNALEQRRKHIETNLDNLTMKACRKLLEEDLGLPEKSLAGRKEFIQRYVDKIIANKATKQDRQQSEGKQKPSKTAPVAKKRKATHEDEEEPKAQPRTSKTIDKVKQICKAATIKIPPSAYVKTKSVKDIEDNMRDLLAKYGLSLDSSPHDISKTCDRLAKERDLEGIDVSNIVSGDRRARRSAAVAAPIDYAAIDKSSSDEDDDSANEQASSSEDGSDVVGKDEAVDMDDDACEADIAADASPPATSDVKKESKKSEKQTENGDADDNGMQDTEQEVAKVKRRKAVIDSDDSDDD